MHLHNVDDDKNHVTLRSETWRMKIRGNGTSARAKKCYAQFTLLNCMNVCLRVLIVTNLLAWRDAHKPRFI